MKLRYVILVAFLALPLIIGCSGQTSITETSEAGVLSPDQVDSSMVDQIVKVRGEILWVVQNPGGLGGLYAKLGEGESEISIRIQGDVWETLDEKTKAQFEEGKIVTVEGILFQAGKELVVIWGKVSPPSTTSPANTPWKKGS